MTPLIYANNTYSKSYSFWRRRTWSDRVSKNALVVTTVPPELSDKWLAKMGIKDYLLYDKVKPEPSIEDVNTVISQFKDKNPSVLIGLGGGSSMDVVK